MCRERGAWSPLELGALGDFGGPTLTRVPASNSTANGPANDANRLAPDQRGVSRTTDCETGAVEIGTRPDTPIFHDGFRQGETQAWSETVPPP